MNAACADYIKPVGWSDARTRSAPGKCAITPGRLFTGPDQPEFNPADLECLAVDHFDFAMR
jgi:hypothetical protein